MTSRVALCAGGVTPIIPMMRTGMFHLPDTGTANDAPNEAARKQLAEALERLRPRRLRRSVLTHSGKESFCHHITGDTGWIAVEFRGHLVALFQVEAGSLNFHRVQGHPRAAAAPTFFFSHLQEAAAEPVTAQLLGQKKAVNSKLPARARAIKPANHLAGRRIGDEHRERTVIVVPCHSGVIGAKTIGDD